MDGDPYPRGQLARLAHAILVKWVLSLEIIGVVEVGHRDARDAVVVQVRRRRRHARVVRDGKGLANRPRRGERWGLRELAWGAARLGWSEEAPRDWRRLLPTRARQRRVHALELCPGWSCAP